MLTDWEAGLGLDKAEYIRGRVAVLDEMDELGFESIRQFYEIGEDHQDAGRSYSQD